MLGEAEMLRASFKTTGTHSNQESPAMTERKPLQFIQWMKERQRNRPSQDDPSSIELFLGSVVLALHESLEDRGEVFLEHLDEALDRWTEHPLPPQEMKENLTYLRDFLSKTWDRL